MPPVKEYGLGHYIPRSFVERFKGKVPHSVAVKRAASKVYFVVDQCEDELRDLFSDKKFLKLLEPKTEKVQDKDSGFRTMTAIFSNRKEKEKTQRELKKMAQRLSVELDQEIHAFQVAAGMFHLFNEGLIALDIE